MRPADYQVPRR